MIVHPSNEFCDMLLVHRIDGEAGAEHLVDGVERSDGTIELVVDFGETRPQGFMVLDKEVRVILLEEGHSNKGVCDRQ